MPSPAPRKPKAGKAKRCPACTCSLDCRRFICGHRIAWRAKCPSGACPVAGTERVASAKQVAIDAFVRDITSIMLSNRWPLAPPSPEAPVPRKSKRNTPLDERAWRWWYRQKRGPDYTYANIRAAYIAGVMSERRAARRGKGRGGR